MCDTCEFSGEKRPEDFPYKPQLKIKYAYNILCLLLLRIGLNLIIQVSQ